MTELAIWTDYAGVLTEPNSVTLDRYCGRVGIAPADFQYAMRTIASRFGIADAMEILDRSLIPYGVWAKSMQELVEVSAGVTVDFDSFAETWFTNRELNIEWIKALQKLRDDGCFVGLISNMVPEWDQYRKNTVPDSLFDSTVLSFDTPFRKPEVGIFQIAERKHSDHSTRSRLSVRHVLVDDLLENCHGAVAAGWDAVHHTDTQNTIRSLAEMNHHSAEPHANEGES